MKTLSRLTLVSLALVSATTLLNAQNNPGFGPPSGQGGQGGFNGPPGGGQSGFRPPAHPVSTAIDANDDGMIDAREIANIAGNLKKLDRNGDGKLSDDETRPPHPGGGREGSGPPGGAGGQPGFDGPPGKGGQNGQGGRSGFGPPGGPGGHGERGGHGGRQGPPKHPIVEALDRNGNGTIEAAEMAQASRNVMKLDVDRSGTITRDEMRPKFGGPGSSGQGGPGAGQGGRGGVSDQPGQAGQGGQPGFGAPGAQGKSGFGAAGQPGGQNGIGGQGGGNGGGPGGRPGMNGAQNGAGQNQQFDPTVGVMRYDKNRDGKVTKQEMPVIYHSVIDRGDRNRDGALDRAEVLEMYNQIQRQRGQGGNGGASGAAGQPGQSGALPRRPKFDQ